VVIEIPPDTLSATGDVELIEPEEYAPVAPDPDKLEQAAQVLGHAKNPIIWAGGGVHISRAWEALQRVAEHLQAPVLTTPEGKGAISDRHYLSMGATTAYAGIGSELVPKADAILVVGSRFVAPATASWGLKPGQQVVQVDIDAEEVGRNFPAAVGVVGDARLALEGLYERMQRRIRPRPSRKAKLEALKKTYHEKLRQVEPQGSFVEAIRAALPEDCIYIAGMTQVGYYSHIFFPVYRPRTYITSSYMGTLGYEYPTALGAKVAHPDRPVVVTIGDGGFLYNAQELATAVKYNIPVVAVVFNDNAYGNSLRDQKLGFNGRVIGTELHNPNFVKFTESFGAVGLRARDDKELQFMLKEALADGRPTVIEVPVGPMPNPFRYRRL
jgi:acetolactate synthase-1/2/3 large subunit